MQSHSAAVFPRPIPGVAPAARALEDKKTPLWIRDIAAGMVGDVAPADLIFAEPGTPPRALPARQAPAPDYAPAPQDEDLPELLSVDDNPPGPRGEAALALAVMTVLGLAIYGGVRLALDLWALFGGTS